MRFVKHYAAWKLRRLPDMTASSYTPNDQMWLRWPSTPRKRRSFTDEQKAEAVRLVQGSGRSVHQVARDLDLSETALRRWVKQADIDAGKGAPGALNSDQLAEFRRLRQENQRLRMERDFLKKAAAFFAKDSSSISS